MAQQRQVLVSGLLRASHERLNELNSAPPLAPPPWLMHPAAAAYMGPSPLATAGAAPNNNPAMMRTGAGSLTNLASVGLPAGTPLQPAQFAPPSVVLLMTGY